MEEFLTLLIVTHAYIFFSRGSTGSHDPTSTPLECSPTDPERIREHEASVPDLMPENYRCRTARPVSYYALFE